VGGGGVGEDGGVAWRVLQGEREYEVKRLIDCRLKGEARPDYILSPSTGKLRPSPPPSNRGDWLDGRMLWSFGLILHIAIICGEFLRYVS
jgi:hypothetical protein